ncbi:MAG: porin family protein [Xanthobacteraceae bacterium]|nr:porin family protein [Xanthobacteraceae bacterium]
MKNLLLAATAVFGAVAVVAPAFADEAPAEPKPVRHVEHAAPVRAAPVRTAQANPSWTGAQVGGQGGVAPMSQGFAEPGAYLFPGAGTCFVFPSYCAETPFNFTGTNTGATGGGFVGYRIQMGTMVVGIEGDANAKSTSSSYTVSDSNGFRAETFTGTVKQGADGSIRGRFGFLVTPWVLVYGTGGIAFGSVTGSFGYSAHEIDGFGFASATGGGSWSTTRSGATGGAGIEAMLTQQLALRLEYRYTDLGRFNEAVPISTVCGGTCSSPSSGASVSLHPTFQAIRLGLGVNF